MLSATVNATELNPALAPGVSWAYQLTGGITGTQTQTVAGPGTFNGASATEVDVANNLTAPSVISTTVKNYLAFTSQGLVEYGTITVAPGVTTVTAVSPALIEFPSTLTAGVPVTNTYAYGSSSSNSSMSQTSSETVTLTLASATPQTITVPAGTFNAYEVDDSTTGTGNGTVQSWFAPNVGIVKQIISTSTQPIVQELTSFTGFSAGTSSATGSGALTPSLKKPITSSLIATAPLNWHNALTVTVAGSAVKGVASAEVLLSKDTKPSDSVFTLASGKEALHLTSAKSRTLPLKFAKSIPATVAPGTYNVLLVSTDPSGGTQTVVAQEISVAAPVVDLTGSIVKAPVTAKAGRRTRLTFTIANTNAANVAAIGDVQVQFETSSDGSLSDASLIDSLKKKVNIKPGKHKTFTVSLVLDATSFIVVDLDPGATAFPNDADPTNNVFATSQTIIVS